MKWFTRQWQSGDPSDDESEKVVAAYWAHVESLLPRLPATVRALAQGMSLHDGRIRRCLVDSPGSKITLTLRCGELASGYFDLELTYCDVVMLGKTLKQLKSVAGDPSTEALYDEIDSGGQGRWVHRILFWPYREVSVQFRQLELRMIPRKNRDFRRRAGLVTLPGTSGRAD
jgi:hypothetical protein